MTDIIAVLFIMGAFAMVINVLAETKKENERLHEINEHYKDTLNKIATGGLITNNIYSDFRFFYRDGTEGTPAEVAANALKLYD